MVEAASGIADDEKLGNFANFSRYMSREYTKSGLLSEADSFRVNSFVEGFHDALLLFALAVDYAISAGIDWRDGREITNVMRSRKVEGVGGFVLIDETGNRMGDYSLLAMVENNDQQFKFKVCLSRPVV